MTAHLGARLTTFLADAGRAGVKDGQSVPVTLEVRGADTAALEAAGLRSLTGTEPVLSGTILRSHLRLLAEVPGVLAVDLAHDTPQGAGWRATLLGVVTVAELVLLLGAFVPVMQTASALDANQPATLSYLGWSMTATKPGVFVVVSLLGGALGGALHAIASLTAHVAAGDFGDRWTMWYLANPVVGAALATVFLLVLQAGLGGQAAPTTGGLYGIAAVAAMTGLFSRHALNKLKDIFDVAFASKSAVESEMPDRRTAVTQPGPAAQAPPSAGSGSPAVSGGVP